MKHARPHQIAALTMACLLAGCDDSANSRNSGNASVALPSTSAPAPEPGKPATPPDNTPVNQAPEISGTAPAQATVGQLWSFQPAISDPDGDALNINASNLPGWINLDRSSGRLSGTPTDADVQTWSNIVVSISDGNASASLPAFSVSVIAQNAATGTATLSWLPPTLATDGSPVGELSGYRLLYGQNSGEYTQTIAVNNPGITRYMIEGLTSGDWYFAIQTVDANGLVSEPSTEARKTI